MAGICSKHHPDIGIVEGINDKCKLCHVTPHDLFPDWDQKVAEAEAAGEVKCFVCGFKYFATTNNCPLCYLPISQSRNIEILEPESIRHSLLKRLNDLYWHKNSGMDTPDLEDLKHLYQDLLKKGLIDKDNKIAQSFENIESLIPAHPKW